MTSSRQNDTEPPVTVASLEEGHEAIVYSLAGGKNFSSRLAGMGVVPGVRIKVLRKSGGSVIIFASGTRVALGTGEANKILVIRVPDPAIILPVDRERKTFLVALAGQPNVGKSTVFNVITGLSQHVGNWPGKTVEKKEGFHSADDFDLKIVDLPGTYSLSALSEEERVAREFIIHEQPDVVVVVVDASALERSLYLLTEILLLEAPVVLAVNMIDVAEQHGTTIDIDALRNVLGLPVVPMVAAKNKGIKDLLAVVIDVIGGKVAAAPRMPRVTEDHAEIFARLVELIGGYVPPLFTDRWVATKLMEGDPEVTTTMEGHVPSQVWADVQLLLRKHEDALRAVVGGRYDWIEEITRASVSHFKMGQMVITDRIDHLLTRPVIGIPVLFAILAIVFLLTYEVGFPLQEWLESLVAAAGRGIGAGLADAPLWLKGLVIDGILGGVGSVLTFVPLLMIFFAVMAFLENVGYMARAAFVMDKFMHIIGLHGKSFLPMCLGFGCNVPSVLGARIVESKKARLLTIFLAPFIPCTGRLAVLTFVTAAVFGEKALVVTWSLVVLNILALGFAGILISRLFLKDEPIPFIMELPLYHRPDARTIIMAIWARTVAFIKKAGTIILVFSVVLWVLANVPGGTIDSSILARIGRLVEPIGAPLGLDWKMIAALLSSIIAKENAVATLGVLYDVGDQGLRNVLPGVVSHASALSFLVVLMVFVPCLPTITVMKQEMADWRWFAFSILFMLALSFSAGMLAYHGALRFGL